MTQQPPPTDEPTPPTQRTPESDNFPSGPAVGEALPNFALPNQHGAAIDFSTARDGHKALVVFHRSTRW
ncbi:MAG TPA: hypothetical protein QF624_08900 [Dehalococcoidia bacterium]|nr:hypothetical protein [Dehalococcoidia bacterium]